jgi:hypothetical protein
MTKGGEPCIPYFSHNAHLWYGLYTEAVDTQFREIFHLKHVPSDPMLN